MANVAALHRLVPGVEITVLGRRAGPPEIAHELATATGAVLAGGGAAPHSGRTCVRSAWPSCARRPDATSRSCSADRRSDHSSRRARMPLCGTPSRAWRSSESASDQSAALALVLGVPRGRLRVQVDDAFDLEPERPRVALPDGPFLALTLDASFASDARREATAAVARQLARVAEERGWTLAFVPHYGVLGGAEAQDGRAGRLVHELTGCPMLPLLPVRPERLAGPARRGRCVLALSPTRFRDGGARAVCRHPSGRGDAREAGGCARARGSGRRTACRCRTPSRAASCGRWTSWRAAAAPPPAMRSTVAMTVAGRA